MPRENYALPVEILLVEDNPGDARLTTEALKEGRVLNNLRVAKSIQDFRLTIVKLPKNA